eukprot:gene648-1315_t
MEAYVQAIIAILVVLFVILLIWAFCIRKQPQINHAELKELGDYSREYNLINLHGVKVCGFRLKIVNCLFQSTFGKLFIVPFFKKNRLGGGFYFNTISDYVDAYRSGKCTPTDVAQRALDAMAASEEMVPQMRIFVQSNSKREEILEMARLSTQRYKANTPLSIFDGIPISAKDEFKVAGYPCFFGTPFLGDFIETEDSESAVVRKLRQGGAVILGVTNMQQLGLGITGCNGSRLHGTARNPYNVHHYTGGSSSGSGASVAAGIGPMSLGVDGGGSTRIPAAACGVVGVKGTFGRISCTNCFQFTDAFSHPGPLCPTVRDAAISYAFLAGPDPDFPPSLEQSPVSLDGFENTNLNGVKIGVDWEYLRHGDADIVDACTAAIKYLEDECQAEVISINIPELEEARVAHIIGITSEMRSYSTEIRAKYFDELSLDTQMFLSMAQDTTSEDYHKSQKQRTRSMLAFEEVFKKVDCVITPTMPMTMPEIETGALETGIMDATLTGLAMKYMFLGNLIGIPSISIPVGYCKKNMPIGLHIATNWWDEAMMFRVAHAAEGALKEKAKPQGGKFNREADKEVTIPKNLSNDLSSALWKLSSRRRKRDVTVGEFNPCNMRTTQVVLSCPKHRLDVKCKFAVICPIMSNGFLCRSSQYRPTCCDFVCR